MFILLSILGVALVALITTGSTVRRIAGLPIAGCIVAAPFPPDFPLRPRKTHRYYVRDRRFAQRDRTCRRTRAVADGPSAVAHVRHVRYAAGEAHPITGIVGNIVADSSPE